MHATIFGHCNPIFSQNRRVAGAFSTDPQYSNRAIRDYVLCHYMDRAAGSGVVINRAIESLTKSHPWPSQRD